MTSKIKHEINIWSRTRANYRVLKKDWRYKLLIKLIKITDSPESS